MLKIIEEYKDRLSNEEIGMLVNKYIDYKNNKNPKLPEDRLLKYLFEKIKKVADKELQISKMRSEYAKKGGGRPRKEKK